MTAAAADLPTPVKGASEIAKVLRSDVGRDKGSADHQPGPRVLGLLMPAVGGSMQGRVVVVCPLGDDLLQYVLAHAPQIFKIADVRVALPGVSDPTIRLMLEQLKNEGRLIPQGRGRSAVWLKAPTPR